jgi:hypothetical protein
LVRQLLESYGKAQTPKTQRDILLHLKGVNEVIALTKPVTHFEDISEMRALDISEAELAELLRAYWENITGSEEKECLARIQNFALRARVTEGVKGSQKFSQMMNDLQKGKSFQLILM